MLNSEASETLSAQMLVARRISEEYPKLSSAQRRFADFVMQHPLRCVRMSIQEAVGEAGVSVATANRFATTLGFDGYQSFRNELVLGFEHYFVNARRLERKQVKIDSAYNAMVDMLHGTARHARAVEDAITPETVEAAVAAILGARLIYVAGVDIAGSLGALLTTELIQCGCDARTNMTGGGLVGSLRQLSTLNGRDLLIAIAMPLYFTETVEIARVAHENRIPVLSITDSMASPLAPLSDTVLCLSPPGAKSPPLTAAILAAIQGLAAAVGYRSGKASEVEARFISAAYPWMRPQDGRWPGR